MPPYIKNEGATVLTTEYTDFVSIMKTKLLGMKRATLVLINQHASYQFTYRGLVSNNPEGTSGTFTPVALDAEGNTSASLAGESSRPLEIYTPWAWIDVQIKSEGDSESPQAAVWLLAVG